MLFTFVDGRDVIVERLRGRLREVESARRSGVVPTVTCTGWRHRAAHGRNLHPARRLAVVGGGTELGVGDGMNRGGGGVRSRGRVNVHGVMNDITINIQLRTAVRFV